MQYVYIEGSTILSQIKDHKLITHLAFSIFFRISIQVKLEGPTNERSIHRTKKFCFHHQIKVQNTEVILKKKNKNKKWCKCEKEASSMLKLSTIKKTSGTTEDESKSSNRNDYFITLLQFPYVFMLVSNSSPALGHWTSPQCKFIGLIQFYARI